jgi:hypothetical protein
VHKQETVMPGSPKVGTGYTETLVTLEVYVTTVSIKLSVQNGVSNMNDLVSGEACLPLIESR